MIQIIPKPEKKPLTPERIFSFFSLIIFLFSLFLFFYLTIQEKKAHQEIATFEEKISNLKTPEIKSLEDEISNLQKKISAFSKIIEDHSFPSQFFSILEKNTHSEVYFSDIKLDLKNPKCILSGQASNFSVLAQQLYILQNIQFFQTKLSKISLSKEGKVDFELEIVFDKNILKK